jgi:hypothetical protein
MNDFLRGSEGADRNNDWRRRVKGIRRKAAAAGR